MTAPRIVELVVDALTKHSIEIDDTPVEVERWQNYYEWNLSTEDGERCKMTLEWDE